jgi:hypothetical protein
MGHYDSCYEADNKKKGEEKREDTTEEMKYVWDNILSVEEKEFVLRIANRVDEYMTFFKVIKRMAK